MANTMNNYIICSTPRSGSNLLCEILSSLGFELLRFISGGRVMEDRERVAFEAFKARVDQVGETVQSIERDLARRDIFVLATRCRDAIRTTKDLLDKNMAILFEGQPAHLREDLYDNLRFAEGHVIKALSDEVSFQQMDQRLYLAAQLTLDVINRVTAALAAMEREIEERPPQAR